MRSIVAAAVAGVALALPAGAPRSLLTLAQQDSQRSPLDAPSAAVSADGLSIAFTSFARLVPADVNNRRDIYLLDLASGQVTLETTSGIARCHTSTCATIDPTSPAA